MNSRSPMDTRDPLPSDDLLDEEAVLLDDDEAELEHDLATDELYDTAHSDGHTYNPQVAWEQGLTYTPPDDPPVLPADNWEGVEIAAGYATSMEDTEPDDEIDDTGEPITDAELEERVAVALRSNSETMDLTKVRVRVEDGVAILLGSVPNDNDESFVADIVADISGIVDVDSRLDIEY